MSYPSDDEVIDLDEIDGEPWNQHPDESDKAYRAFQAFKDMGRERSKLKAYLSYSGKSRDEFEGDSAPTHVYQWAKKFNWNERVKAWDQHIDEKKEEKFKQEALDYAEDMAENANIISKSMLEALRHRFEDKDSEEIAEMLFDSDDMDLEAFARTLTQAQNIADKAFGQFTDDEESGEIDFLAEIRKIDD